MIRRKPYSRIHDPEAQRTRAELWLIIAIVVVVVVGALAFRVFAHKPAKPQKGWDLNTATYPANAAAPAAAGVRPPA